MKFNNSNKFKAGTVLLLVVIMFSVVLMSLCISLGSIWVSYNKFVNYVIKREQKRWVYRAGLLRGLSEVTFDKELYFCSSGGPFGLSSPCYYYPANLPNTILDGYLVHVSFLNDIDGDNVIDFDVNVTHL